MQTFYFQCFKKDKAVQFQHKHSNLLPHRQLPPSPRVAGSAVTSFPAKTLNCHISRTRHTRIPLFARNWGLVTPMLYTKNHAISSTEIVRIWPVFVPLCSDRGRAEKKVTALNLFRCPIVHWPTGARLAESCPGNAAQRGIQSCLSHWTPVWSTIRH